MYPIVKEEKLYQIICAEYQGQTTDEYSDAELLIGKSNIKTGGALLSELVLHHLSIFEKIKTAKLSANADASVEERIIKSLKEIKI